MSTWDLLTSRCFRNIPVTTSNVEEGTSWGGRWPLSFSLSYEKDVTLSTESHGQRRGEGVRRGGPWGGEKGEPQRAEEIRGGGTVTGAGVKMRIGAVLRTEPCG